MSAPQQPWGPPPSQPTPQRPRFSWLALVAMVIAVAALVVAVVGLVRASAGSTKVSAPATSAASASPTPSADNSPADRALCNAIAPLMGDYDQTSNAWLATGATGTPPRDAALPKYKSDTDEWARRSQEALDGHPAASAFFIRTLQRFIDDRILLVHNMAPGPSKPPDDEAWSDSMTAYGGPLLVCGRLGINW